MGSPISPLLSAIFMIDFEEQMSNTNIAVTSKIVYWIHYFDDILYI